jgi:two-component system, cell cycle response regulator DivK
MMGARILVVEDNPVNLELVRYLLEKAGHTVFNAEDGQQGLRLARQGGIDLIISDLRMPEMDGFEFLQRLRQDEALRDLPVIAVTAFSMSGDQDKVLVAGFDAYLAKPIVPETFVQQIESYLSPFTAAPRPRRQTRNPWQRS